jgi:hypothetical protein
VPHGRQQKVHLFVDNSNLCYGLVDRVNQRNGVNSGNSGMGGLANIQVLQLVARLEQGRTVEERWVCGSGDRPQHRQLKQQYKECSFKIKWDARSGSVVVVAVAIVGIVPVQAPYRYFFGTCFCCYSLFLRPERNVDEALHA